MVCILLCQLLQINIKTLILQIIFIAIDLNIHIYSFIQKLSLENNNQFLIDDIKFLINKYLIIINTLVTNEEKKFMIYILQVIF